MPKSVTNALLVGSCNGQDSLGDVCLLRAVIQQISSRHPNAHISVHMNKFSEPVKNVIGNRDIDVNWGLQTLFWRWKNKWRHTRLPEAVYTVIASMLFPMYLFLAGMTPTGAERRALRQIFSADLVYIYGGTNFARRWYWLNTPYFLLTMLLGRISGAKVILGPQQFGPMSSSQRWFTRLWLKLLADDYFLRNSRCLVELGVPKDETRFRLLFDEVYSNTECYPARLRVKDHPRHLLVNVRGGNLMEATEYSPNDMEHLGATLSEIQRHIKLPILWFTVSGESFCDDSSGAAALHAFLADKYEFTRLVITNEFQFIESARHAIACISMSFHGCILSLTAGIPAIPVVDGDYYEYKYADFERYAGGCNVPVIRLNGQTSCSTEILDYIAAFDANAVIGVRDSAANAIGRAYSSAQFDG